MGGLHGGVYLASTTLSQELSDRGFSICEIDTTLKDISVTAVSKRIGSVFLRNINFLIKIFFNPSAKYLFVFLSAGNSYVDKFLPIVLAKLMGKNVIVFPRSGHLLKSYKNPIFKFFINKIFFLSDNIICQSEYWSNYLLNNGISKNKLKIVENWVSMDKIEISKSLEFNFRKDENDIFKIVYVGRIEQDKGISEILYLAQGLVGKLNFSIDVYGSGSYEMKFKEEIKHLSLEEIVFFKGWLKKENLLKTINSYDLGLFFSKTEGYPNSLLDFIFAKIPVLTNDIPMLRAVGQDYLNYTEIDNPERTVQEVLKCFNNYPQIIEDAKALYDVKLRQNNIEFTVNKLIKNL